MRRPPTAVKRGGHHPSLLGIHMDGSQNSGSLGEVPGVQHIEVYVRNRMLGPKALLKKLKEAFLAAGTETPKSPNCLR